MEVALKPYVAKARELEVAIYTEKMLMREHKKVLQDRIPVEPQKKEILPPQEPLAPDIREGDFCDSLGRVLIYGFIYFLIILMVFSGIRTICALLTFIDDVGVFGVILGLLLGPLGVFLAQHVTRTLIQEKRQEKINKTQLETSYQQALKIYPEKRAEYEKQVAVAEAEYETALKDYSVKLAEHKETSEAMMTQHDKILHSLIKALEAHYAKNIIFPKYRSLVAISTIDEYLQSGRCDRLEGSDGAYNLYEAELRQNLVIGQLSLIVTNLEQIKNNQFLLYQELHQANLTVNEILSELKWLRKDTKLMTYFSYVSAKAATSPRYTRGYIY